MYIKFLSVGIILCVLYISVSPVIAENSLYSPNAYQNDMDAGKENFNCIVIAKTTNVRILDEKTILGNIINRDLVLVQWCKTYLPLFHRFVLQPILFMTILPIYVAYVFAPQLFDSRTHGNLVFGNTLHCHEHNDVHTPSTGWVWTKGSEGVVTWEGSVYGYVETLYGEWSVYYWDYYVGASDFKGLKVRVNSNTYFIVGLASHVALGPDPP
jgi:hypothetical protein